MFDPHLIGMEAKGIHHLVNDTIGKCDIDVRRSAGGMGEWRIWGDKGMGIGFGGVHPSMPASLIRTS